MRIILFLMYPARLTLIEVAALITMRLGQMLINRSVRSLIFSSEIELLSVPLSYFIQIPLNNHT